LNFYVCPNCASVVSLIEIGGSEIVTKGGEGVDIYQRFNKFSRAVVLENCTYSSTVFRDSYSRSKYL